MSDETLLPSGFRLVPGVVGYAISRDGVVITSTGRVLPQSKNTSGKPRVVLSMDLVPSGRSSRDVAQLVLAAYPELATDMPRRRHARKIDGQWIAL